MSTFGRLHTAGHLSRELLAVGWQFCHAEAGRITSPEALAQGSPEWLQTTLPNTAAGAMREAKRWSLDGTARNFDADDWWFRLNFTTTPAEPYESVVLHFGGLATIADVWLNGEHLLHSENMFCSASADVSGRLRTNNQLLIRFAALDTLLAMKRPRPRWKTPMIQHQQLRWLRTTLLGRTPGWSPPAAAVGPWRDIWLERQTLVRLHSPQLRATLQNGTGQLQFTAGIDSLRKDTRIIRSELILTHATQRATTMLHHDSGDRLHGVLTLEHPVLWWPHTHGEPALYKVDLHITVEHRGVEQSIDIDLGHTGFRTVTLDTSDGNFVVAINDVPIFCRGACWTPPDVVTLDSGKEQLERSVQLLRAAGMNMLRVGGTMVYENDEFLDLCDANGILLWQDLMFANMDYPETSEFLAQVRTELTQQSERLSARPCLTILCGNSEGEQQAAMFGATRDRWSPALFHRHIPELLTELLPDIPYWPSSAHGGSFPHQNNVGTTSYYGVGAYLRPLEDARFSEVRFATECLAFANVPENSSIEKMPGGLALKIHHPQWKARTPRDLGAGWDFEDVRDFYLQHVYGINPAQLRYADHMRYLELSRSVTGEVMAATFSEWRRRKSNCNGALVWFWQDLWHGAGWGLVDADGQPKSCYYYLRRALQPITVSFSDEGCNGVCIHLCNDTASSVAARLSVKLYKHHETLVANGDVPLQMEKHSAQQMDLAILFDYFADYNHAYRFGPAGYDLLVAKLISADGALLAEACYLPLGQQLTESNDLGLSAQVMAQTDDYATVKIDTRAFARAITIHAEGFEPTDQYFNLAPHSGREIGLRRLTPGVELRGSIKAINTPSTISIQRNA